MEYELFNIPTSTPANPFRWDATGRDVGVPELILVGHECSPRATPLPLHHHGAAYEFHFMERGIAAWEIKGQQVETRPGQILCTGPYELHQGVNQVINRSRYWWMIVTDPSDYPKWLGLKPSDRVLVQEHLQKACRLSTVPLWLPTFKRIRAAIEHPGPLTRMRICAAVLDFILEIPEEGHSSLPRNAEGTTISEAQWKAITEIIVGDITRRPSVGLLASSVGVSPSHFYRQFAYRFGLSPLAYWNHERIHAAAHRLLASDASITEIAMHVCSDKKL